jgi:hypothetical protein
MAVLPLVGFISKATAVTLPADRNDVRDARAGVSVHQKPDNELRPWVVRG